MADTIDLHLNIQNSLEKTLKQTQNTMKGFNSLLEKSAKNFNSVSTETDKVQEGYKKIENTQKEINKGTSKWRQGLKRIAGLAGKVFGGLKLADTARGMLNVDKSMKQLSFRMGEMGQTTNMLKDSVYGVSHATGIATDKAAELVGQLRRLRVPSENIAEMAINTARFSEVTGASAASSSELAGNLMRVGRLGKDATTNVMAGIVRVQRSFGLTEQEVEGLNEGLIESTKMLHQMGKSGEQIESFNKGVVKLAGAFTSVGISAQEANKFVSELLDPGRVEDNALLYAKLGISLEDAFSGDVDPGMLAGKFKELGSELRSMSGPAAAAMAKQLGMPLGQLRAMADMDLSEIEKTLGGGADGASELAQAQEQQLSAQDRIEKTMNRIQNTLQKTMNDVFMPLIDKVLPYIEKAAKWLLGKINDFPFKEFLVGAIIAAIVMLKIFRKRFKSVSTDVRKSLRTAIYEGMNQGAQAGSIAMQKAMGGKRKSQSGRGGLEAREMANNASIEQRLQLLKNERMVMAEQLSLRSQQVEEEMDIVSTRIRELDQINRTAEQDWELNKLYKMRNKMSKEQNKIDTQLNKQRSKFLNMEQRQMQRLSDFQLRSANEQLQAEQEVINTRIKAEQRKQNEIRTAVQLEQEQLNWMAKQGELSPKLEKEIRDRISLLESEENQHQEIINSQIKELTNYQKQEEQIRDIAGRRGLNIDVRNPMLRSGINRLGGFLSSTFRKAGSTIAERFRQVGKRAKEIGQSLIPGRGGLKALGGMLGKVASIGGPIMLIARMFGKMEPVQEAIGQVLEALKPIFEVLLKDILLPLVKLLLPPLLKLLGFITKILGKLIWAIGKVISVFSKDVGDKITQMGDKVSEAGDKMISAADTMASSFRTQASLTKREMALSNIEQQLAAQGLTINAENLEELRNQPEAMAALRRAIKDNTQMIADANEIEVEASMADMAADLRDTYKELVKENKDMLSTTRKDLSRGERAKEAQRLAEEAIMQGDLGKKLLENTTSQNVQLALQALTTGASKNVVYDILDQGFSERGLLGTVGITRGDVGASFTHGTQGADFNAIAESLMKQNSELTRQQAMQQAMETAIQQVMQGDGLSREKAMTRLGIGQLELQKYIETNEQTQKEVAAAMDDPVAWLSKQYELLGKLPEDTGEEVGSALSTTVTREWTPAMVKATEEGIKYESGIKETITTPEKATQNNTESTAVNTEKTATQTEQLNTTMGVMYKAQEEQNATTNSLLRELISVIRGQGGGSSVGAEFKGYHP